MSDLNSQESSIEVVGVLRGVVVSLALLLVSGLILGIVVSYTNLITKLSSKLLLVLNYTALFIGGVTAAYVAQSNGWLNGGLVGLVYMLLIVLLSLFWLPFNLSGSLVLQVVIACLVSSLGGMIGVNII